jgi:uncharacterized protein YacL
MKKLITGISLGVTNALLFAPLAFAATDTLIDPCDTSATATINSASAAAFKTKLCGLSTSGTGGVIRNAIVAVLVVATIICLFFLIRGGINWILSGGDKGKVDAARATIVAAIIGLIITFLAYFILSLVLQLFGLSFSNLAIPSITGN